MKDSELNCDKHFPAFNKSLSFEMRFLLLLRCKQVNSH